MLLEILVALGIGAFVALLTTVALTVAAWVIRLVVDGVVRILKKINEKVAIIRKNKARRELIARLEELLKKAAIKDKSDIQAGLNDLKSIENQAWLTPVDQDGQENWNNVKVVKATNNEQDEMKDRVLVSDEGRFTYI